MFIVNFNLKLDSEFRVVLRYLQVIENFFPSHLSEWWPSSAFLSSSDNRRIPCNRHLFIAKCYKFIPPPLPAFRRLFLGNLPFFLFLCIGVHDWCRFWSRFADNPSRSLAIFSYFIYAADMGCAMCCHYPILQRSCCLTPVSRKRSHGKDRCRGEDTFCCCIWCDIVCALFE